MCCISFEDDVSYDNGQNIENIWTRSNGSPNMEIFAQKGKLKSKAKNITKRFK